MRRSLLAAAALFGLVTSAHAADKLTLQLKWVPQAQFAGYYVAAAKGYYTDAGLDVVIKPGGPDINPSQVIAGGGADVIVDWMPSALAAREKGVRLVNIAQVFEDPQIAARGMKIRMTHPLAGEIALVASPIRMSETPPAYTLPPPRLGEHTRAVLGSVLALDEAACDRLAADGVI